MNPDTVTTALIIDMTIVNNYREISTEHDMSEGQIMMCTSLIRAIRLHKFVKSRSLENSAFVYRNTSLIEAPRIRENYQQLLRG